MVKLAKFSIQGLIPSKKNNLRPSRIGGYYYADTTKSELDGLVIQAISAKNRLKLNTIADSVYIEATIQTIRDQDYDNMYTTIQDILQKAKIIKNDNQVKKFLVIGLKAKSINECGVDISVYKL